MSLCNLGRLRAQGWAANTGQLHVPAKPGSSAVLSSAPECVFQLQILCQDKFWPQQEGQAVQLDQPTLKTQTKPSPRPPRSNFEVRAVQQLSLGGCKLLLWAQLQEAGTAHHHLCFSGPAGLRFMVTETRSLLFHLCWFNTITFQLRLPRVYEAEFSLTSCFHVCQNPDNSYHNITFANMEFTQLHF